MLRLKTTAVIILTAFVILMLSSCSRFGDGLDYVYGYYPISDQKIDDQSYAAHKGVERILGVQSSRVNGTPEKRSLNKQNDEDKQWFREEGALSIQCKDSSMKTLENTEIPCGESVNYILDWRVKDGKIIGLIIDGIMIVNNVDSNPVHNHMND